MAASPPSKKSCSGESIVVLVTGGTGLVGEAFRAVVAEDPQPNEKWVFLSSKDGDLRYKFELLIQVSNFKCV